MGSREDFRYKSGMRRISAMEKPKVGDMFEAYFGGWLETARVVEWVGFKCYFSNGWYLLWRGEAVGFIYR
jgi:hypothetical protein